MKPIVMKDGDEITVGPFGNYCELLVMKYEGGKYYCRIADWEDDPWDEVPSYLAKAMIRFEEEYRNETI